MNYGFVTRNLVDLRGGSDSGSERKSQLLFHEPLEIGSERNGYLKVYQADGYHGWVRKEGVIIVGRNKYRDYCRHLNYRVIGRTVTSRGETEKPVPRMLFYGTDLIARKIQGNRLLAVTVDGRRFTLAGRGTAALTTIANLKPTGQDIVREAKKFLNVPYLWGGVSPFGFDCSGLVRAVLARFGIYISRDSKDQRKSGEKVSRENIKPGDLLFFPGHVAIAVNRHEIIHASSLEGGVGINSLEPGSPDFRADLYESLASIRRIVK